MFEKLRFGPEVDPPTGGSDPSEVKTTPEIVAGENVEPAAPPKDWQKEHETYVQSEPQRLEEARQDALRRFAMQSPENYKFVTKQDAPPGTRFENGVIAGDEKPPAKPGEVAPEDRPLTVKEYEAREAKREKAMADQRRAEAIKGAVYDEFDKFEDVFDPAKNELAELAQQYAGNAIREEVKQGRNPDVAKIVAETAKRVRGFVEKQKAGYVETKVKGASTPAPSGKGAPPGKAPEGKLTLGRGDKPGTYANKLRESLKAAMGGGSRDDK